MICPECKKEMINGYLNAPGLGITWQKIPSKLLVGKKSEHLQDDAWSFKSKDPLSAYRCNDCKLIIFKY